MKHLVFLVTSVVILGEIVSNDYDNGIEIDNEGKVLVQQQSNENDDGTTTTASGSDECNITTIISKSSGKITSVNYPKPYPTNCQWSYIIHVGEGHSVKVVVERLDLSQEDTLTIIPSINPNAITENSPRVISAESNSSNHFEVDAECCDSVIIKFEVGNHSNNHTGFSISYQRNEETTTTTQKPPPLTPTFGWNQVYLCGLTISKFKNIEPMFKEPLIGLAENFYDRMNVSMNKSDHARMRMVVNGVVHCPRSWPWSANCIQVNYSIIERRDTTELTSEHLSSVWDEYRNTEELTKLGIWEYEIPDVEWLFWFWIILLSFISLFFCLLLVIIIKTKLIYFYFKKLKIPDFGEEVKKNIENWKNQNSFAYPLFTSENPNRFRFCKEYERAASEPAAFYAKNDCHYSNQGYYISSNQIPPNKPSFNNTPANIEDDFDSDDDQHIYNTLT